MPNRLLQGTVQAVDRVVVPVEGSDGEYVAQQWAVELASSLAVPVHAVHVAPSSEAAGQDDWDDTFQFLDSMCDKWGVEITNVVMTSDDIVRELVDELKSRDLVVIGTRHLVNGGYHVGSIAGELVRQAPCPVQIVRLDH